jgi:hypothetical protein
MGHVLRMGVTCLPVRVTYPQLGLELGLGAVQGLRGGGQGEGGGLEAVAAAHAHVDGEALVVGGRRVGRAQAEVRPVLVHRRLDEPAASRTPHVNPVTIRVTIRVTILVTI